MRETEREKDERDRKRKMRETEREKDERDRKRER